MDIFDHLDTIIELLIVAYFLIMRARQFLNRRRGDGDDEAEAETETATPERGLGEVLMDLATMDPETVVPELLALRLEPLREGQRIAQSLQERLVTLHKLPTFIEIQRDILRLTFDAFAARAQAFDEALTLALEQLQNEKSAQEDDEKKRFDYWVRRTLGELTELVGEVDAVEACVAAMEARVSAAVYPQATHLSTAVRETYGQKDDEALSTLCLPETPGHQLTLTQSLRPRAVVFIPPEADNEPLKWGAVVQSIALSLVREVTDLYLAITPPAPPWLPRLQGRQVYVDFDAQLRHWGPYLAADALGVMLLGPAAMESLILEQALRGEGLGIDEIDVGDDPRLVGPVPPMLLRGAMALHVLASQGFEGEALILEPRWSQETNESTGLLTATLFDQPIRLPLWEYLESGTAWLDEEVLPVLRSEIFHAEVEPAPPLMTPDSWFDVRQMARTLLAKKPTKPTTGLMAVAVAIEAAVNEPGASNGISHWLLQRLAPREDLGSEKDPKRRHGSEEPHNNLYSLRNAFILREVLQRPHGHGRRSFHRPNQGRGRP